MISTYCERVRKRKINENEMKAPFYLKVTYRLLSCKHNGPWGRSRFEVACVIYHKMCSLLSF